MLALALTVTSSAELTVDDAAMPLEDVVVVTTQTERQIDETPATVTVINLLVDDAPTPADYRQLVRREPLVSAPFLAAGTATTSELRTESDTERFRSSAGYAFRPAAGGPSAFDQLEARVYLQDACHTRSHARTCHLQPAERRQRGFPRPSYHDTQLIGDQQVASIGEALLNDPAVRAELHVTNLFDREYYAGSYSAFSVNPREARTGRLSAA